MVRVAIQALSAVCGGAQSLHTNSFDEALALPSEHAATIALRTQQILMHEAGTTDTADPLGGSYYIEALTAELEERARELIERVDELGGAVAAIEAGFVQGEIEESAFRFQSAVESGVRVVVGVNEFTQESEAHVELHRVDPAGEQRQRERTARMRAERNAEEAGAHLPPSARQRPARATSCPRCARPCAWAARSASSAAALRELWGTYDARCAVAER